jgi:hypothetical protein
MTRRAQLPPSPSAPARHPSDRLRELADAWGKWVADLLPDPHPPLTPAPVPVRARRR